MNACRSSSSHRSASPGGGTRSVPPARATARAASSATDAGARSPVLDAEAAGSSQSKPDVRSILADGPATRAVLADLTGLTVGRCLVEVTRLRATGLLIEYSYEGWFTF